MSLSAVSLPCHSTQDLSVQWNVSENVFDPPSISSSDLLPSSSSPAQAVVESGQYVHNPEWDLTPFQLWKRKQAAKAGAAKVKNLLDNSDGN